MRHPTRLLPVLLLLLAAPARADEPASYLTKDGQLAQTLEIIDVQGGFAGFTGTAWVVEPSGKYAVYRVFNQKRDELGKGELSKEQLAALAKELDRYGAADLKGLGKPMTNPHVVTVKWGKSSAELNLGAGEPLPKASDRKEDVGGRFAGVVAAVQAVAKPKKEEK
jgi:hypothetical protein